MSWCDDICACVCYILHDPHLKMQQAAKTQSHIKTITKETQKHNTLTHHNTGTSTQQHTREATAVHLLHTDVGRQVNMLRSDNCQKLDLSTTGHMTASRNSGVWIKPGLNTSQSRLQSGDYRNNRAQCCVQEPEGITEPRRSSRCGTAGGRLQPGASP